MEIHLTNCSLDTPIKDTAVLTNYGICLGLYPVTDFVDKILNRIVLFPYCEMLYLTNYALKHIILYALKHIILYNNVYKVFKNTTNTNKIYAYLCKLEYHIKIT